MAAAALAMALGLSHPAIAQSSDALSVLTQQGQYWQAQGDTKRAAEAWKRLLNQDKNNARAMRGLVETALQAGQHNQARTYLNQFKAAYPNSNEVASLEHQLRMATPQGKALLQQARDLAKAGKVEEAAAKYREFFGDTVPSGALAREYYDVLGYTEQGSDQAVQGLRRLQATQPEDRQVALELARHLTRNESTRLEGISELQKLSGHPDVGKAATESWRQALLWMGADNPRAEGPLQAYLSAHPDDQEIAQLLARTRDMRLARAAEEKRRAAQAAAAARPDPLTQRAQAAIKLMDSGHTAEAKKEFLDILDQRKNHPDALGGLGVILLREGDVEGARTLLRQAARQNRNWSAPLRQAENSITLQEAEQKLNTGNTQEAIRLYQSVVKTDSKNAQAYSGLIHAYLEQGDTQAAQRELQRFEKTVPKNDANGQASLAETRGAYYFATGQLDKARSDLENALVHYPSDPWVRYQLAQIYLDEGRTTDARNIMDGLMMSDQSNPQVITANALFASKMQDWPRVQQLLNQVPPAQRNSAMRQLAAEVNTREQLRSVSAQCDAGQQQQGLSSLAALSSNLGKDPQWLGTLAEAYIRCGQPNQALLLIDQYSLAHQGKLSTDMVLQRAGILMQTRQPQKAFESIQSLNPATLTASQRRSYDQILIARQVQKADLIREQGRLASAYDELAPLLQSYPEDPALIGALARLYASAGQNEQALDLYKGLQERPGQDPSINLDVARLALQSGQTSYGKQLINELVAQQPNNVNTLVEAARIYRETGHSGEAADMIKKAMALQQGAGGILPSTTAPLSSTARSSGFLPAAPSPEAVRAGHANPFLN